MNTEIKNNLYDLGVSAVQAVKTLEDYKRDHQKIESPDTTTAIVRYEEGKNRAVELFCNGLAQTSHDLDVTINLLEAQFGEETIKVLIKSCNS